MCCVVLPSVVEVEGAGEEISAAKADIDIAAINGNEKTFLRFIAGPPLGFHDATRYACYVVRISFGLIFLLILLFPLPVAIKPTRADESSKPLRRYSSHERNSLASVMSHHPQFSHLAKA